MAGGQSPLEVVFEDESAALSYSRTKQLVGVEGDGGAYFGEFALMKQINRSASVLAKT
eukprot:gene21720-27634_t